MPRISGFELPKVNFNFRADACEQVMTEMLNRVENDYATVEELRQNENLSRYTYQQIYDAVDELDGRGFLHKLEKPYGCIYAVNKLCIPNMGLKFGQ